MARVPVRTIIRGSGPWPFFNGHDAFHVDSVAVRFHGCMHLTHRAATTPHVGDVVQVSR